LQIKICSAGVFGFLLHSTILALVVAHLGATAMILYHGTNSSFEAFTEEYFGSVADDAQSSLMGIWTSLTPVFPMSFAQEVLVLKIDTQRILQIPSHVFKHLSADFCGNLDSKDGAPYIHPSVKWRASGYDLVAAIEPNGSIGDLIILNRDKTVILERVASSDIDRLLELESDHWDDRLMSQRSRFVEALADTVRYRMAM
jgi:hypothetical protein